MLIVLPLALGYIHGWDFTNLAGIGFRFACIAVGITMLILGRFRARPNSP